MPRSTKISNRLFLRLAKSTVLPLPCPHLKSKRIYSRFLKPNFTQRDLTEKMCISVLLFVCLVFFLVALVPKNLTFIFLWSLFKHHYLPYPNPSFLDCPSHANKKWVFSSQVCRVCHSPGTKTFSIPSTLCMAQIMLLCIVQVLPVPTFADLGRDSPSLLLASIPLH